MKLKLTELTTTDYLLRQVLTRKRLFYFERRIIQFAETERCKLIARWYQNLLQINMVEGNMVPTVHVVACEKDASSPDLMNDYNIGDTVPGSATLVADTHPCPIYCGKSNILNK